MKNVLYLKCTICGEMYAPDEVAYVCPKHGNEGILDVVFDYDAIGRNHSPESIGANPDQTIWRYKPLIPVQAESPTPPLAVGGTPLYDAPRLAAALGLAQVWVKDDGRNPTASFKDRASAIAVVKAQEAGANIVTTASTGNAAAALSGICASVGMPNVIFVPESAPPAKIAQLLAYGSTVLLVQGTYDDAFDLCMESAEKFGWYNRNTGFNPYMSEGKKTVSFEICEQLGWEAPDAIFVSVGDGCIIGGVHKGLKDLVALGWIDKMPRIFGVQAAGSNYIAEAWENGEDIVTKAPIDAQTAADSISAGLPRDRIKALRAVTETNGAYVTVADEVILAAIPTLAQGSGVFAEPAGAAAYAGLQKAVADGLVSAESRVVVINTGNGLKDIKGAMAGVELDGNRAHSVAPNLAAVEAILGR